LANIIAITLTLLGKMLMYATTKQRVFIAENLSSGQAAVASQSEQPFAKCERYFNEAENLLNREKPLPNGAILRLENAITNLEKVKNIIGELNYYTYLEKYLAKLLQVYAMDFFRPNKEMQKKNLQQRHTQALQQLNTLRQQQSRATTTVATPAAAPLPVAPPVTSATPTPFIAPAAAPLVPIASAVPTATTPFTTSAATASDSKITPQSTSAAPAMPNFNYPTFSGSSFGSAIPFQTPLSFGANFPPAGMPGGAAPEHSLMGLPATFSIPPILNFSIQPSVTSAQLALQPVPYLRSATQLSTVPSTSPLDEKDKIEILAIIKKINEKPKPNTTQTVQEKFCMEIVKDLITLVNRMGCRYQFYPSKVGEALPPINAKPLGDLHFWGKCYYMNSDFTSIADIHTSLLGILKDMNEDHGRKLDVLVHFYQCEFNTRLSKMTACEAVDQMAGAVQTMAITTATATTPAASSGSSTTTILRAISVPSGTISQTQTGVVSMTDVSSTTVFTPVLSTLTKPPSSTQAIVTVPEPPAAHAPTTTPSIIPQNKPPS
jgi:hypothetical protein